MPGAIKRPRSLKIGYAKVTVVEDNERLVEQKAGGMYVGNTSRIYVEEEQASDYAKMALLHEVLHGCVHVSGTESATEVEEHYISVIAPVLLQALRDNPALLAYLLQKP